MRFLILFILLLATPVFAQRGVMHYSRENGLISNEVNDLTFDSKGFLWIATNNGIDRFDGQRFIHFTHNPSDPKTICGSKVTRIAFDGKNTIWAGTLNKGLIQINTQTFTVKNQVHSDQENSISDNQITAFEIDSKGSVWLSPNARGLDHVDIKTGKISNYRPTHTFSSFSPQLANTFYSILQDRVDENLLWCVSPMGLFSFSKLDHSWQYFPVEQKSLLEATVLDGGENNQRSIVQDGKGNLYIGASGGSILYFDQYQQVFRVFRVPELTSPKTERTISALEWRDTRYLYTCVEGVEFLLFDTRTKEFIRFQDDEQADIQPFHIVRKGSQIAICSKTQGLYIHNESLIYGTRFPLEAYGKIVQSKLKSIVVAQLPGSNRFQIRNLDRSLTTSVTFTIPGTPDRIFVAPSVKNDFVAISDQGLFEISPTGKINTLSKEKNTLDQGRSVLLQVSSDGKIWLYSEKHGLSYFSRGQKKWFPLLSDKYCFGKAGVVLSMLSRGTQLYLGCSEGILAINTKTLSCSEPEFSKELPRDGVLNMLAHGDNLWIGTQTSGLIQVSLKKNKVVRRIDERVDRHFTAISELRIDALQQIWVRTPDAIVRIDPKGKVSKKLDQSNGMAGIETIACFGKYVYFFQSGSVVWSRITDPAPESVDPKPYIQRVIALNNEDNSLNLKRFDSNQNSIRFEFGVLDYGNARNNEVFYRLQGLEENWRNGSGKDEVSYYNLPGGDYTFEVRIISNGKTITSTYEFEVLNPIYLRWWFVITAILVLAFSIWLYVQLRIKRIENTERMKAQFSAEITEMESKALRAQMNPHFLFNSLNSIRLFVLKNEVDSAANYIAKFSKLLRQILNHSRQDMIAVYDEITSLKLYLEFERLRFDRGFDFDLQIDGQEVLDCQIPPLIIQPFVENAIWHGIMPRMDDKGYIKVSFERKDNGLYVTVTDNGIGRDKARENNSKRSLKEGSVGLQITKERLKSLSIRTKRHNSFEIIDLFDENNQPTGTLVKLYFEL